MVNTEMLNARIEGSGYKRAYIASELNITRQSFCSKVNNSTEFLSSEVQNLCRVVGIESLDEKEAIFFADTVD